MTGNVSCWVDRLEVYGKIPTTFEDFECVFLEHNSPLNNASIARDKFHELKVCRTIQDYIMAFGSIVMLLTELREAD